MKDLFCIMMLGSLAIAVLGNAAEIQPGDMRVLLSEGDTLKRDGKTAEAAAAYDKVFGLGIANADEWLAVARDFQIREDADRILKAADKALALEPSLTYAWRMKADAYLMLDDGERYTACLDQILAFEPEDEWALGAKAMDLYIRGSREEGLAYYERLVALRPDDAGTWATTAFSLSLLKEYELSWRYFDRALELDAGDFMTWFYKGTAFSTAGRYEDAIACFERVLALDPSYYIAAVAKGRDLYELGRTDEALATYDHALETTPEAGGGILLEKAAVLSKMARFADADACYRTLLENDPGNTVILYMQALNHVAAGEDTQALVIVKKIRAGGDDAGWALLEYALAAQSGVADGAVLSSAPAADEWEKTLLQFLNGGLTGDEIIAAARNDAVARCQAEYFAGLRASLAGAPEEARSHYAACIAAGAEGSPYTLLAKRALAAR